MKLISALDDLRHTTLCAFAGALRKLEYLAGLQTAEKKHSHWGLERVYGASTAEKTLNQEHQAIFGEILATPLRALSQEAEDACKVDGVEVEPYLEKLHTRAGSFVPPQPGAGSTRHFNSVLQALAALARSRPSSATPQASSRRRPPAR
jgi:hypothetical protein